MVYGTSTYIDEQGKAVAAAEFYDFAPCDCVCLGCFVPEAQKKRTFLFAYDNKAMLNKVRAPLCCLMNDEACLSDVVSVFFYDKPPFTTGNFLCIPLTCCGPPVISSYNPKFLCIDCAPCVGSQILVSPCNCYGLKSYIICGNPCYTKCACPLVGSLKNPGELLRTRSLAARHPAPLLCPSRTPACPLQRTSSSHVAIDDEPRRRSECSPWCSSLSIEPARRRLPRQPESRRDRLPKQAQHRRGPSRHLRERLC